MNPLKNQMLVAARRNKTVNRLEQDLPTIPVFDMINDWLDYKPERRAISTRIKFRSRRAIRINLDHGGSF